MKKTIALSLFFTISLQAVFAQQVTGDKTSSVDVKLLRRGGFAAVLSPLQ